MALLLAIGPQDRPSKQQHNRTIQIVFNYDSDFDDEQAHWPWRWQLMSMAVGPQEGPSSQQLNWRFNNRLFNIQLQQWRPVMALAPAVCSQEAPPAQRFNSWSMFANPN